MEARRKEKLIYTMGIDKYEEMMKEREREVWGHKKAVEVVDDGNNEMVTVVNGNNFFIYDIKNKNIVFNFVENEDAEFEYYKRVAEELAAKLKEEK